MKKLWKVLIPALVLALVFACIFVFGSSAADDAITVPEGTVEEDGDTVVAERWKNGEKVAEFKSLWDAYNASSGKGTDTVKVVCDFVAKNSLPISNGNHRNVAIDLCGHTIYVDGDVKYGDGSNALFNFAYNTNVNFVLTSSVGRGKIVATANAANPIFGCYTGKVETPNNIDISNIDIVNGSNKNVFTNVRNGTIKLTDVTVDGTYSTSTAAHVLYADTPLAGCTVTLDFDRVEFATSNSSIIMFNMGAGAIKGTVKNSKFTTTTGSTYAVEFPNVATDIRFEGCDFSHTSSTWGFMINTKNITAGSVCTFDKCTFNTNQQIMRCETADPSHNNTVNFNDCEFTTPKYAMVTNGSGISVTGKGTRVNPSGTFIWDNTKDSPVTFGYGIRFSRNTGLSNGCDALTAVQSALIKDGLLSDTFPYVYTAKVDVKFNYPDGTSVVVPTHLDTAPTATSSLDFNAVAIARAFTAKNMAFAGWATTEGATEALAALPAITDEQVGTTVNYYPVLKSFDDTVDYVVIEGENGRYGTSATWGEVVPNKADMTITLIRDTEIAAKVQLSKSVKIDLNGHNLTSAIVVSSGTTYAIVTSGSVAIWSSKPGAHLDIAARNGILQSNWATGDVVIGASSVSEVTGKNPYSGNMDVKAKSIVVCWNNSVGGLYLDGMSLSTDNVLLDMGFNKTGGNSTVLVKNCDITSGNYVWQYGYNCGEYINAKFENCTVSVKNSFFGASSGAHKLNIEFSDCYLNGNVASPDGKYSTNVEGTLKLTGNTYVNGTVAPEATFGDGKALRPVVKTVNGVTYTQKVGGEKEILGIKFNLTLYSNFNLNIYVLAEYGLTGDTVEIDGHTYTKHEYVFAANEIAKAQSIKLGDYDAISISVLDYAKALFALEDSALMKNEKILMADALVYANAAAKLIDNAENDEITALLTANASYKSTLLTFDGVKKDMSSVSDGFISASLDLTSQPKFVFTIVEGAEVSVSYTNFWGARVTKTQDDAVDEKIVIDGKTVIYRKIVIDNMRIFDFANEFTLKVGEKSATYSLKDYAADTNVKDLCNALYTYIETAKEFKKANPEVQ